MSTIAPALRTIRRRNALVPLPLLPPVPRNTIVTSVRIVHNQCASDPLAFDTSSRSNSPHMRPYSTPPSPTSTNLCFAPPTAGGASKRLRSGRRRSSCTPCQPTSGSQKCPPAKPTSNSVLAPVDTDSPMNGAVSYDNAYDSSLLNPNRKPRSTIVVTVRLANPPPSNASHGTRMPHRAPDRDAGLNAPRGAVCRPPGIDGAWAGMLARKAAHQPRVSSPLASRTVTAGDNAHRMEMDPGNVSPLSSPPSPCTPLYVGGAIRLPVQSLAARHHAKKSRKGAKAKNGGRVGMLRWAVLNNSGPEVGRRILSMGPKLAKEIWEAERVVEEIEAVESNEMEVMEEPKQESEVEAIEERQAREKLAEECIRELEEMEVDSEDVDMESPSVTSTTEASPTAPQTQEATEKATKTQQAEHNNNMDLDMLAPVAVVAPLSTARQVQFQAEISVQVFSSAKKAQKDSEKSRRWFERIAL